MCVGAILQARLDHLVYGPPNTLCGAAGSWVSLIPSSTTDERALRAPSSDRIGSASSHVGGNGSEQVAAAFDVRGNAHQYSADQLISKVPARGGGCLCDTGTPDAGPGRDNLLGQHSDATAHRSFAGADRIAPAATLASAVLASGARTASRTALASADAFSGTQQHRHHVMHVGGSAGGSAGRQVPSAAAARHLRSSGCVHALGAGSYEDARQRAAEAYAAPGCDLFETGIYSPDAIGSGLQGGVQHGDVGLQWDEGRQEAAPRHAFHTTLEVTKGVLADECADIMRGFFQQRRRDARQRIVAQDAWEGLLRV
jgi:tRNA(Arg) A34 adenosine deaminase TadA